LTIRSGLGGVADRTPLDIARPVLEWYCVFDHDNDEDDDNDRIRFPAGSLA
jgi:hypothetical protein